MLCGVKWWAIISFKQAIRLSRYFRLDTSKKYGTNKETIIDDLPKTWKREGKYKCWFIEIRKYSNGCKLIVRGSLHKFYHGNNSGLFTGKEVLAALDGMYNLYEVEPSQCHFIYLEVGINLPVIFLVFPYLQNNLIRHKRMRAERFKNYGKGYEFKYEDYLIKVYEKDKYILRFEIKYKKDKLENFAVELLSDLSESIIIKLVESLFPEWNHIILANGLQIYDKHSRHDKLTPKEREKILEFDCEKFHQDFNIKYKEADVREKARLMKQMCRLRKTVVAIINSHTENDHEKLGNQIKEGIADFKMTF